MRAIHVALAQGSTESREAQSSSDPDVRATDHVLCCACTAVSCLRYRGTACAQSTGMPPQEREGTRVPVWRKLWRQLKAVWSPSWHPTVPGLLALSSLQLMATSLLWLTSSASAVSLQLSSHVSAASL